MRLLGTEVRPVSFGTRTLKEATSEAIRDWITNVETTYFLIGTVAGPAPYPSIVRAFQSVIGVEARDQMLKAEGRIPEVVVACVGGGSNAIGIFASFIGDAEVALLGVEAAGAASLSSGRPGVLHGARTSVLADADGQILDAVSLRRVRDWDGPPGIGCRAALRRCRSRESRRSGCRAWAASSSRLRRRQVSAPGWMARSSAMVT
jgi:tryptophan synthase beta chain